MSVVGGVRSLFNAEQRSVSGVPPLALISPFVCHNCPVPGFTDGAGFRFGVDATAVEVHQI